VLKTKDLEVQLAEAKLAGCRYSLLQHSLSCSVSIRLAVRSAFAWLFGQHSVNIRLAAHSLALTLNYQKKTKEGGALLNLLAATCLVRTDNSRVALGGRQGQAVKTLAYFNP
jgi:hypothetical protein